MSEPGDVTFKYENPPDEDGNAQFNTGQNVNCAECTTNPACREICNLLTNELQQYTRKFLRFVKKSNRLAARANALYGQIVDANAVINAIELPNDLQFDAQTFFDLALNCPFVSCFFPPAANINSLLDAQQYLDQFNALLRTGNALIAEEIRRAMSAEPLNAVSTALRAVERAASRENIGVDVIARMQEILTCMTNACSSSTNDDRLKAAEQALERNAVEFSPQGKVKVVDDEIEDAVQQWDALKEQTYAFEDLAEN